MYQEQFNIQDDELFRLVSSSSDVSTQYVVFRDIYDELFAINVAKVTELISIGKDIKFSFNKDKNSYAIAIAKIRDEFLVLVDFDSWIGKKSDINNYKIILVCEYGNKRFGILISKVEGISNIIPEDLHPIEYDFEGGTFYVTESGFNDELCTIFDSDKLLIDVFSSMEKHYASQITNIKQTNLQKYVLVAEDSMLIQKKIKNLFDKMNITYVFFMNGQELLDEIQKIPLEKIGIIITDIEMPELDGIKLLKKLQEQEIYKDIPKIVNTNMSNKSIVDESKKYGAIEVVKKLDLKLLEELINKFAKR
jgi:two-component system chemotaxis response regulator CheV